MIQYIYCDESGESNRFMVLGGIIIPEKSLSVFNSTMNRYRKETNINAELKWTKVSKGKLNEYKSFVDYFFALNNTDTIHFRSLIVDTHKLDHGTYSGGNRELGFYKFYYQLLLHCFGKEYCKGSHDKFMVFLDHRSSMKKFPLTDLRKILNNGLRSKYSIDFSPFVSVQPKDSKHTEMIQLTDIILGAVGYRRNGFNLLAEPNSGKNQLSKYILDKSGFGSFERDTPRGQQRFTIWNFKLREK